MNYIKKIILFLQNLFHKNEIKAIDAPAQKSYNSKKEDFINSLKNKKNKKIETLICEGDGLGIQKKVSY